MESSKDCYVNQTWVWVSDTNADLSVSFIVSENLGFVDMDPTLDTNAGTQ